MTEESAWTEEQLRALEREATEAVNRSITQGISKALGLGETSVTAKPPTPAGLNDWERIPVDTRKGSDFAIIDRVASSAARAWAINSPDGPMKKPAPLMHAIDGAVHEALLHLLELGVIDIDTDRLRGASGWPLRRQKDFRELSTQEPT
ncbi:hypothetical protein [Streptomyces sp. NPDC096351]|uniref:hypothetical protein n=1 Tax=Streptomyces sp. NPDC096351 TaxID=3366087 RepID=UPI003813E38B